MTTTQALEKIIQDYGLNILQQPEKIRALFKDLCPQPEYIREVNLLLLALEENIPNELIQANPINDIVIMRLAKKLEDAYFTPAEQAYTAIETWAKALNITLPKNPAKTIQVESITYHNGQVPEMMVDNIIEQFQSNFSNEIPKEPINELDYIWTDPATNLMWTTVSLGHRRWKDAITTCTDLILAGYDDWRLPTIEELEICFSHTPSTFWTEHYWSISDDPYRKNYAYGLSSNGNKFEENKVWASHIRAVRGKNVTPPSKPITPAESTITTQPIHQQNQPNYQQNPEMGIFEKTILGLVCGTPLGLSVTSISYAKFGGWGLFAIFILIAVVQAIFDGSSKKGFIAIIYGFLSGFWLYIFYNIWIWFSR